MNNISKILVHLLSTAIRNHKPNNALMSQVDWYCLYEEALSHQVHTLIFPVLSELPPESKPNQTLIDQWRIVTMSEGTLQFQHMDQISIVLNELYNAKIPVVALKGLILRNYYPSPELRTMGDADILVHSKDIIKAKKLIKSLGYSVGEKIDRHISFYHKKLRSFPTIELHWILSKYEITNKNDHFTSMVWENVTETRLNGVNVLCLSSTDQIMHLMLHAAGHILSNGFGLRQLCDLVMFIEGNDASIDWKLFRIQVQNRGLYKFVTALFSVCNRLFDMRIPSALYEDSEISYIDLLIDDIISAGVYGRRDPNRVTSTRISNYIDIGNIQNDKDRKVYNNNDVSIYNKDDVSNHNASNVSKNNVSVIKLRFLFPPAHKLGIRYTYAKKHQVLLPIAWVHRGFHNIKKLKTLRYSKEVAKIGKERAKLLHWLQLR